MRVPRNFAEFERWSKTRRSHGALAEMAGFLAHNNGLRLKALDPARDAENRRLTSSVAALVRRCCDVAARAAVDRVLREQD